MINVIINGSGGCGKDEFVKICKKYRKILNVSTIDPIKDAARLLGWDGEKTEKNRKFLSTLKDIAEEYLQTSTNYILKQYEENKEHYEIMFIHVREPKQIENFKSILPHCISVLIDASKRVPVITTNHADAEVFNAQYDYVIDNNGGLFTLEQSVKTFLSQIKGVEQK